MDRRVKPGDDSFVLFGYGMSFILLPAM